MSFFSKLLRWPEESSETNDAEEAKNNSLKIERTMSERQLVNFKVNVNTIYNKTEEYQPVNSQSANTGSTSPDHPERTLQKFRRILENDATVDIEALKKMSWQGIPQEFRPFSWRLLLKYAPVNGDIRESTVSRKREDYKRFVDSYYVAAKEHGLNEGEQKIMKIIVNDVFRTQPSYRLFHHKLMQEMMIKVLWVWHVRHPASGYVQGMNDLITPFLTVFMKEHIDNIDLDVLSVPPNLETNLTQEIRDTVEADTFWCLSKILDPILDNFTFKTGTDKAMCKIKDIIKKIDMDLYNHFERVDPSEYIFKVFSLRWLFSLLVREFPMKVAVRLFDTYISDEQGFNVLHLYVCAALLLKWSIKLQKMTLDNIMVFLQDLPTKQWSEQDLNVIIAEAFVFKTLYQDSTAHFTTPQ